jgi:glycine/serine hydroxymethyltransferase
MGEGEMRKIAAWTLQALAVREDAEKMAAIAAEVEALCVAFPVPAL